MGVARVTGCIIWGLLVSLAASAADVAVWPINPRLNAGQSSISIWVKNNDQKRPVVLQARVQAWSQHQGEDHLDSQNAIVVSPAMVTLAPGAQQLLRIVNRAGAVAEATAERSYRVFIDEIPSTDGGKSQAALSFQVRYSLPLFLGGQDPLSMKPEQWRTFTNGLRYELVAGANPQLRVHNRSDRHVRLSRLKWRDDKRQETPLVEGLLGYVLPGQSRAWPITAQQWQLMSQAQGSLLFQQDQRELTLAAQ